MRKYASIIKLVCLLVVAPVLMYVLTLSKTVGIYGEYMDEKEASFTAARPGRALPAGESACAPLLSNGALVREIAGVCDENGVSVGHYSPAGIAREGDTGLVSAELKLTGGFVPLLKVLSYVESLDVRVSDVDFSALKVGKTGRTVMLDVGLLQIEKYE